MIDRTNIGIFPSISNQKTTSFVAPQAVEPTPFISGEITNNLVQNEAYTAPIIDQGYTLPQTTTTILPETQTFLPETNFSTTYPHITLPDQTFTSYLPQITTSYMPTTEFQTMSFSSGTHTGIPGLSVLPEEGIPTMSVVPDASVQSIITPTPIVPAPSPLNVASSINTPGTVLPPLSRELISSNPLSQTAMANNGVTVPPPIPQNGPAPPVMDEDFHRARPIYGEINQNKYKRPVFGR